MLAAARCGRGGIGRWIGHRQELRAGHGQHEVRADQRRGDRGGGPSGSVASGGDVFDVEMQPDQIGTVDALRARGQPGLHRAANAPQSGGRHPVAAGHRLDLFAGAELEGLHAANGQLAQGPGPRRGLLLDGFVPAE